MPLLRSFGFLISRFYKYVAPTALRICFAMFCCGLLVSGCSKSNGGNGEKSFPIRSKFFSSVQIIGSRGTGVGQFNKPRSLALDRDDNLFVVDTTGRVQKFSPDGKFLLSWQMPQTDLGKPKGMGRDSDGNVIVVEPHYMRVNHFTSDGKMVFQWGIKGTNEGQLMFPRSVAINSRGELSVSEYGLVERVQHFSKDGKTLLGVIGKPGEGAGEFNRAEGIGIDAKDQLYVADSCNHRIQIFSPDGKFLRSYGKAGSGLGELSYPYDVRVDANGFQFVCEFGNSRIQIFDANDQPVEILGEVGAAPGQFANPWSIDFDSHGNFYVADALNHRVQKFIRVEQASRLSNSASRRIPSKGLSLQKTVAQKAMQSDELFPRFFVRSFSGFDNALSRIPAGRRNQQARGLFYP